MSSRHTTKTQQGLYTYLVNPIGPVLRITDADGRDEIHATVTLTRSDGVSRANALVVRATEQRPDLLDRAEAALRKPSPTRMVVAFERLTVDRAGRLSIRSVAVVETVLDGTPAVAPGATNQLELFA